MLGCACKVSTLPDEGVQWLESEMARNRPYKALVAEVQLKYGVRLFPRTLTLHKQNHMGAAEDAANEWRQELDKVRDEIRKEMAGASALTKPLYLVALRNLDALEDTKPSQASLIQSIQALAAITGNASDRDALAAYAVASARSRDEAKAKTP